MWFDQVRYTQTIFSQSKYVENSVKTVFWELILSDFKRENFSKHLKVFHLPDSSMDLYLTSVFNNIIYVTHIHCTFKIVKTPLILTRRWCYTNKCTHFKVFLCCKINGHPAVKDTYLWIEHYSCTSFTSKLLHVYIPFDNFPAAPSLSTVSLELTLLSDTESKWKILHTATGALYSATIITHGVIYWRAYLTYNRKCLKSRSQRRTESWKSVHYLVHPWNSCGLEHRGHWFCDEG